MPLDTLLVVSSEGTLVVDAGTPVASIVPQADSLQAVIDDEDIAVIASNTNTALPLGTNDFAVTTFATTVVL